MVRRAFNNFRGIQFGRDCWVTDLEFATVMLREEYGTAQPVWDKIVCGTIAVSYDTLEARVHWKRHVP